MPVFGPVVQFDKGFDVALAIQWLGAATNQYYTYTGTFVANTEAEYNAITWTDSRPKPTWADLIAGYPDALRFYYDILKQGQGVYDLYLNTQSKLAALPSLAKATASTPARALNTAFKPSDVYPTLVTYTVKIQCTANLVGGQSGLVQLLSDSSSNPTTERCSVENTNSVSLAIALTAVNTQRAVLSYLVPAGHYVKLVSTLITGTPVITLVSQSEVTLGI